MAATPRQNAASHPNNDSSPSTTRSRTPASGSEDNTPRTEATPAIVAHLPTPSRINTDSDHDGGYFALVPTESHPTAGVSSIQASPTPSIATSASTSSLKLREAVLDATRRLSAHFDSANRPAVQRDFSTESNDSTLTIRAASGPRYPNQAFSALHQQQYPPPHLPPGIRARSLHPTQPVNFSSAIAQLHGAQAAYRQTPSNLALTPGLFNLSPTETPETPTSEGSAYPSPYLHHLHTQIPKETHVADIDVDPISGRKIINGYEIIDELGRGTHGKVKLGRSLTTGNYVAIKIVERYSKKRRLGRLGNAEDKVKKEVAILKKARHPNIVALLEVIDDPTRKKVYIVLERVDLGEIQWRTDGAREIAMIECRRYERECRGIFDDEIAEQEDQAMLDLARVRRVKAARHRMRQLKKSKQERHHWSIELAGESDEDSEIDAWSRLSASTDDRGAAGRLISRTHTPAPPDIPEIEIDATFATSHHREASPTRTPPEADNLVDRLEGSMYGGYDEPNELAPKQHDRPDDTKNDQYHNDLHALSRNISHGNLLERAAELLDIDVSRDLLQVPCMTMIGARSAFRDTLLGLQYLHYQGIIHRDIKPPNLLQTRDRRTKISDFGVSYLGRPSDEEQAENLSESDAQDFDEAKELAKTVGTPAFYAPELCYTETTANHPPVGKAIDVWALGITLFCMLFGRVPFIDQEFIVMRRIADEEIYIPQRRLKPVDPRPKSRPNSHGRHFSNLPGYRNPVALEYEDLDDDLLDLLHRLLTKDPRQRITLEEIRHHPWVLADIPDKAAWLDETDPTRQGQGAKIEVSREDIEQSVVPITIMERIRSGIKKAVAVSLGRSSSTKRRTPSHSGSTTSIASASSGGLELRRNSLRGDESIFSALKASREGGDHPLAQSEVASPEHAPKQQPYFAHTTSLGSPRLDHQQPTPTSQPRFMRDRQASTMSSSGSMRTVKQSDVGGSNGSSMSPESPLLSSSAEDTTESLLSVSAGRLLRGVRERSAMGRTGDSRPRSSSQASSEVEFTHSEPSLAISTASASGMVNPPEALRQITPASSHPDSPTKSKSTSSNTSSNTSPRKSLDHISTSHTLPERVKTPASPTSAYHESTASDFRRAEDENLRRHIAERLQRPTNRISRNSSLQNECPPSPDDEIYASNHGREAASTDSVAASTVPSLEMSPASPISNALPLITPSTSEDTFALGPQESYDLNSPTEPFYAHYASKDDSDSDTPSRPALRVTLDDGGYVPDTEPAVESSDESEYDSDEDDDGGLQMVRRRSVAQGAGRSMSISNATLARRRESVWSKKSSRSGSGGTLMKIRTRSQGPDGEERERPRRVD
ncbi:hypothetical protein MBLNU457_g0371t1 [Dothideomycetes sp. NU457]